MPAIYTRAGISLFAVAARDTCWLALLEGVLTAPRSLEPSANGPTIMPAVSPVQAIQPSDANSSRSNLLSNIARATAPLIRQAIDLLVLVFAYLLYFFIDVQLKISMLPVNIYLSTPTH